MKRYFLVLFVILAGCSSPQPTTTEKFKADLHQFREYFHIPGFSAIVTKGDSTLYEDYVGFADVENQVPMDSMTLIPMASLTKMFTGYMIAQLSQRAVLDQPINKYFPGRDIPDSIKVKHILSHTSEGDVGKHFHYSSRFSWLTEVIQQEQQTPFEAMANANIIAPYDLNNTILLQFESQLAGRKFAKPYVFEGETKLGFVDYGFSAAAGITSTVRDLAKFSRMISHTMVETDRQPGQLYNYGLFGQEINGMQVLWAYGQYDCYSSLFLKVPGQDLTFIIAGNNSLLSDPARLIYGDVKTSLFALSFFKNFLNIDLPGEQLKARAVAESYLGMYDDQKVEKSKEVLREVFKRDNDYYSLTTMHNIAFLKEIAIQKNQPVFTEFDPQLKAIGRKLLSVDREDPYANIYMANCYQSRNEIDSARIFYMRVATAKNASKNWYTNEADAWLKEHDATSAQDTTTLR